MSICFHIGKPKNGFQNYIKNHPSALFIAGYYIDGQLVLGVEGPYVHVF